MHTPLRRGQHGAIRQIEDFGLDKLVVFRCIKRRRWKVNNRRWSSIKSRELKALPDNK
jgi:hypothetical protein